MAEIEFNEPVFTDYCRCDRCGKTLNSATGLEVKQPSAGDISICFGCGNLMEFDETLKVKSLNEYEVAALEIEMKKESPEMWEIILQINRQVTAKRSARNN